MAIAAAATVLALLVVLVGFVGLPVRNSVSIVGTPVATSGGGAQVVQVRASDMQFAPNAIILRAGQPVELTLLNQGPSIHDLTLTDDVAAPAKILAQPGQSSTGTFTFERPGVYTFVCSQPFHQAQGMKGTITVR